MKKDIKVNHHFQYVSRKVEEQVLKSIARLLVYQIAEIFAHLCLETWTFTIDITSITEAGLQNPSPNPRAE